MKWGLGAELDCRPSSKTFAFSKVIAKGQICYSLEKVAKVEQIVVSGMPGVSRISKSHVEK